MKKMLYQIHRWAGIALALFMLIWFGSGLVIMYAPPSALGPAEQLAKREPLDPQTGWLSLGEVWRRSAAQRAQTGPDQASDAAAAPAGKGDWIDEARLVRQAGKPLWLVEDGAGRRFALSAEDGAVHPVAVAEAARIAAYWAAADGQSGPVTHLDTGPQDSSVRNHETLRPFHRFAIGTDGRQLLISARTGEVVRDSTPATRALYWSGNWIHLLRPLDATGFGKQRRDVLLWLAGFAVAASITGLVIGWQRWRPGFQGRPTYSRGRVHPYRDLWNTWHFWAGLIGGTAALLWGFSGFISNNPWQVFAPANPGKAELERYRGGHALPAVAADWRPAPLAPGQPAPIVELAWHRLGGQAVLLGLTSSGTRVPQAVAGAAERFGAALLLDGAARLAKDTPVAASALQTEYDSYYYPRHRQGPFERPLPVLRVNLADAAGTRLYLDPQNGRLLARLDGSRRAYRWLFSALHHWDFGPLYWRPLWDGWMLTWVLLGLALAGTSVVLGCKRLRSEYLSLKRAAQERAADQALPT